MLGLAVWELRAPAVIWLEMGVYPITGWRLRCPRAWTFGNVARSSPSYESHRFHQLWL